MYTVTVLEFLNMGGGEIMLIMAVVLLLFGGKKLPELAKGLGKGIREFKDASEGVKREIHRNINSLEIDEELKKEEEAEAKRNEAAHQPLDQPLNISPVENAVPLQTGLAVENEIKPVAEVHAEAAHTTIDIHKNADRPASTDIAAAAKELEKEKN